jgi:class 3 adenylate cyclase
MTMTSCTSQSLSRTYSPTPRFCFADILALQRGVQLESRHKSSFYSRRSTKHSMIAKRREFSKSETVGDCYVAVTGLPNPRGSRVAMVRFAETVCIECTSNRKLRWSWVSDTTDLSMRFGLHSGPVTASGERSRFQLWTR